MGVDRLAGSGSWSRDLSTVLLSQEENTEPQRKERERQRLACAIVNRRGSVFSVVVPCSLVWTIDE